MYRRRLMREMMMMGGQDTSQWGITFNGSTTAINCGSDTGLDNLSDNAITVEGWISISNNALTAYVISKGGYEGNGWVLYIYGGSLTGSICCATINADSTFAITNGLHHIAVTWNDADDRKSRLFIDGVLKNTSSAGSGNIKADAANTMYIGYASGMAFTGDIGWVRVSNVVRYTTTFTPARIPPPIDVNTIAQWNMKEKAGTTLDNAEGTAARDGTITDGVWKNLW